MKGRCDQHYARDAERGNAGQKADGQAERTEELRGKGHEREAGWDAGLPEKLQGALHAVTAEPAEDFLGAVREDHDCQSQPEDEGDYAATRFEEPFKHGIPPPMAGVADRRLTRPLSGCRRPPMASGGPPPRGYR